MIRAALSICAAAALFVFSPVARPVHAQPTSKPIELNQMLLDRWLALYPAILRMAKPDAAPMSEDEGRAYLERHCAEAGFANHDQCAAVFGYAGMILSACDRRTRSFRDPIKLMRRHIAKIEADSRLSPEQKEKATAGMKQMVARFPNAIPEAHLRLMTANRDRIFEVVLNASADMSARPDGWTNW